MKKLAIAASIMAMTGMATAQNVTVYGVMDTGFQQYNNGTTTITRSGDGHFNSSRLGFKGSEDLGGGLKANFLLEGGLNPTTGSAGSSTVAANEIFNRESWVGLSGAFGEFRVGRQDVSDAESIDGKMGAVGNFHNHPVNGTAVELGGDTKNTFKYISPKLAGFTLSAGFATGNGTTTTTETDAEHRSVALRYDNGGLTAMVGHGALGGATAVAERDFTAYGVKYNFGFMQAGYSYAEGDVSTTGDVKSKSQMATVTVPLSSGIKAHGVYGMSTNGTQASDNSGKSWTVVLSKDLSKRTMLYAYHVNVTNEANSSMTVQGVSAPATAGLDTKATGIGISHVF